MIRNSDEKYFEKARQAALLSNFKRTNIGCVAVYKGHIIAIGCNVCKTHPMQKKYNRYRKPRYMDRERIPGIHALSEGYSTHGYKFFQSEAIYLQNPKRSTSWIISSMSILYGCYQGSWNTAHILHNR